MTRIWVLISLGLALGSVCVCSISYANGATVKLALGQPGELVALVDTSALAPGTLVSRVVIDVNFTGAQGGKIGSTSYSYTDWDFPTFWAGRTYPLSLLHDFPQATSVDGTIGGEAGKGIGPLLALPGDPGIRAGGEPQRIREWSARYEVGSVDFQRAYGRYQVMRLSQPELPLAVGDIKYTESACLIHFTDPTSRLTYSLPKTLLHSISDIYDINQVKLESSVFDAVADSRMRSKTQFLAKSVRGFYNLPDDELERYTKYSEPGDLEALRRLAERAHSSGVYADDYQFAEKCSRVRQTISEQQSVLWQPIDGSYLDYKQATLQDGLKLAPNERHLMPYALTSAWLSPYENLVVEAQSGSSEREFSLDSYVGYDEYQRSVEIESDFGTVTKRLTLNPEAIESLTIRIKTPSGGGQSK